MEKHHVLIDSDLYEQHVDKTFNFQKKKKLYMQETSNSWTDALM